MKVFLLSISFFMSFCAVAQDSTKYVVNKNPQMVVTTFKEAKRSAVPANFYSTHLGFFCKQELLLTKKNIPIHFRLGSMDYCNYMEQKPGYIYSPTHK
jgi:hypothetical protein